MANSNTDISLLAGLSENSSYAQILKDIQAIQKRLEASGTKLKFNIETPERVLKNLNLSDIEKAFDNASNRMSQALIRKFGITDKEAKSEIKNLVNELKNIRLDELNTGNISDSFESTLLKLNAVVAQNATKMKENLSDALSGALTKEVSQMEATISSMNLKTSAEGISKEADSMRDVEDSARLASIQKEKFADANREVAQTADATTNTINNEVNAFMDMNNIDSILNGINYRGQQGSGIFNTLGDSFRNAFSAYSMANLLERALDKVIEAGKEAVSVVKEFDDINVNLQMATGADKETVKELIDNYSELGGELGTLTKSVAESADTFLRQGRSMEETNQLIEDSIVLSKIAKIESEQSAEILTATINGFQLAASEASRVNDILSSIDLHSASDASGIGDALTKVASMANNAGVSLEKTAAMIATIKDVTQDADTTIGTSLKTVLSRMNSIRAGKFIDEETGEALNDVEKVLDKINVSMRDANGQFKQAEAIIDEVGQKWNALDSNTQKAVTTAMGGVYQANKLVALFDNYDKVIELTQVAENSTGTSLAKFNDSYLPSLEAKTQALISSLEALASTTISDELYASILDTSKEIIDLTADTGILKATLIGLGTGGSLYAFQQLVGFLRGSAQELSNFSTALNMVSNGATTTAVDMQTLTDLTQGLSASQMRLLLNTNNLTDAQKIALMVANGTEQELAEQQLQTWGLITAQQGATASTVTFGSAMRGLMATMVANPIFLVTTAVTLGVTAFNMYKSAVEKAEQRVSDLKSTLQETASELESVESEIKNINSQIDELLSKDTLTLTDENDLKRLREENQELENRWKILEAQKAVEANELNREIEKKYNKQYKHVSTAVTTSTDEYGNMLGYALGEDYINLKIAETKELLALNRELTDDERSRLKENQDYLRERGAAIIELTDGYTAITDEEKEQKAIWEDIIAGIAEVSNSYGGATITVFERLQEKFTGDTGIVKNQSEHKEVSEWLSGLTDEDRKILLTCELEEASLSELKQYLTEQKNDIENDIAIEVTFDQSAFNTTMKSYEDAFGKLKSVQDEWNEHKAISSTTFTDLQENGLLQYLQFTAEGLEVNTQKLLDNAQVTKDKAVADLHTAMTEDMLAIAMGNTENISAEAQAVIAELGANTETAGNQAMTSVSQWATLGATIGQVMATAKGEEFVSGVSTEQRKQMSAVYDYYKNLATDISNIDIALGSAVSSGKSAEDLAKAAKDLIDTTIKFYKAELDAGLIDFDNFLNKSRSMLDEYYRDGKISAADYWGYVEDLQQKQLDIYDKAVSGMVYIIDKEVESLEKEQELIRENYESKIQSIQSEIDLLNEANDSRQRQIDLEKAQFALEQAQNMRVKKVYTGERGFVYETDDSAVRDAQNTLMDKEYEIAVSELESKIESLEKAMESEIETIDKEIAKYEDYKKQIQNVAEVYENAENVKYALAVTGLSSESEILQCRTDVLNAFKDDYIRIQNSIIEYARKSAEAQQKALNVSGGDNNDEEKPEAGGAGNPSKKNITVQKFHDGIENGYIDSSIPKDKKLETLQKLATEEIPFKKNEVPVIAKNDELFVNTPQQNMIYKNFERIQELMQTVPIDFGTAVNRNVYNTSNSSPNVTTNFGDIHLHEVQNVDEFANAILKYVPGIVTQSLGKR